MSSPLDPLPQHILLRTRTVWLVILLCLAAFGRAADELRVLPALVDGVAPDLLVDAQLKKLAYAALDRRDAAYEQLKTPEDLAAWQKRQRENLLTALGGFPERTPLNARVTGQRDFGDYRMEKILFESQPGFFVSGVLYLPAGAGPHPAVLMPCGHTPVAKAGALYQRAAISMAKAGIAAFCYDPIGQGERRYYLKADGTPEFASTTNEHQLMGVGAILLGSSLARTMIWDGMRGLDYLQSRPDIRGDRLGCTGVSGGGTMTSYLMALDDRVVAAAPACYLTGYRRLLETIGPQDLEQHLFGQISTGLDHADFVLLRAPKPTLIMAATQDFFDISGAWNVFRQAKRFYGRLGFPERVDLIEADTKHDLGPEMRVASARFFRHWLAGQDDAWQEPAFDVLPEKELLCTPDGNVFHLPGARTYFDLQADLATKLAKEREQFWREKSVEEKESKVRELAHIRPLAEIPKLTAISVGVTQGGAIRIERLILRNDEGTVIPALLFHPKEPSSGVELYVHGEGKQADAGIGGSIEEDVRSGDTVLAIDVRGAGETQRKSTGGGYNTISGVDWPWISTAYLLGQSFVGLRAEDILASARYASETLNKGGPVMLISDGEAGVPALHARALGEGLFIHTQISHSLESWDRVVRGPLARNQQINAVHGALRFYDLPNLIELCLAAEAPQWIIGGVKSVIDSPTNEIGGVTVYPIIRGLWVWKTPSVLAQPGSAEALRDFAKANRINEVYVSVSARDHPAQDAPLLALIDLLHQSRIRVEALLDSIDSDEAGPPRDKFLALAKTIVDFNAVQPRHRFDGIHLDVEPHQRPENKGNLEFFPGLIETFRGVKAIAAPAHLTVNADIPNKLLKGDAAQRQTLLTSVDRVTLMLYELSSPDDGKSEESKVLKLQHAAERYLTMAYEGLDDPKLAGMSIALRTADYRERLPEMLKTLDERQNANPHYLGWASHCYNDHLK
ncbi:MAG: acetylxylan esterase [Chthoniobacter sp.]|uniref:alpha/beta hydrolase family protein n=1 Tax=Chthoniobacter sp. TaxID=2510640 RepID=UPI0032A926F8